MNEATTDTMGPMSMGMIIVPPLPPGRALDPPGRALDPPGRSLDPTGRVLELPLSPGSAQGSFLFPRRILESNGTNGKENSNAKNISSKVLLFHPSLLNGEL